MNIYSVGVNKEYTIYMVKHACEEFETLTDAQAMRICELLSKYATDTTPEVESLQDENSELESELETAQEELEDEVHKNWKLQQKIEELEHTIEDLKHASNK